MPAPKYNSTNPFNNTTHLTHWDTPSSSQTNTACLQTWSRCKHIQAYIKSRPIQLANYTEEQSSSFVENQKPVFVNIYSFNCENNRKQIDGLNMKVYKWIKGSPTVFCCEPLAFNSKNKTAYRDCVRCTYRDCVRNFKWLIKNERDIFVFLFENWLFLIMIFLNWGKWRN